VDFGIDRLGALPSLCARLKSAKLGVLTHAAAVDRELRHLLDVLAVHGIAPLTLFAPEHGFGAAAQDMASIEHGRDPLTGARIVSLYGDAPEDLVPGAADLEPLDVLLIDLADVGARYYTFVWTALLATRAALAAGVHTVLLDRPNPLGDGIEGRSQDPDYTSFVGWERVPVRHGLTLAEMVLLHIDAALGADGGVSAVPVKGWIREALAPSWDRPFVQPSPNMPTFDTALVYPGGCLLEGTNLSEGRGHTRPFEVVGAPWLDGRRLARELDALGLPGFAVRPLEFVPMFHKHHRELCHGVQIHPLDARTFEPLATYVALVALAQRQDAERFRFRTERYEYVDDIPAFDLLTGSAAARQAIETNEPPLEIARAVAHPDPDWPLRMEEAAHRLERAAWNS
jgi:uncharacterized protein YbbC (DUF1343 family)